MDKKNQLICFLLALILLSFAAFAQAEGGRLLLATTTSTQETGILQALNAPFETMNAMLRWTRFPWGAEKHYWVPGDVDVVLVHAREAEDKLWRMVMGLTGEMLCTMILSSWVRKKILPALKA